MGIHRHDELPPTGGTAGRIRNRSMVSKIIMVTAAVYVLQLLSGSKAGRFDVTNWLALDQELVFRSGQVWRLVTYAFVHSRSALVHIAFNMLALFFLGRIVSQTLGEREFLATYLAAAVFSGIVQASSLAIFSTEPTIVLGASGAVSAVFMLFALHYPRMKLLVFGIIPVEARWLLAIVVAYDGLGFLGLAPSMFVADGVRVGHAAHLGGLIFGLLYFRWNMNLTAWMDRVLGRVKNAELPRHNLRIYQPSTQPEADLSDRVDEILAKISREGESSLSLRERRILSQASDQLNATR